MTPEQQRVELRKQYLEVERWQDRAAGRRPFNLQDAVKKYGPGPNVETEPAQ